MHRDKLEPKHFKNWVDFCKARGLDGRVDIAPDYFDASINRVSAWAVGIRNIQKALLSALPTPNLTGMQDASNRSELMVVQEDPRPQPFGIVRNKYCRRCGVPADGEWLAAVKEYETNVLLKRV